MEVSADEVDNVLLATVNTEHRASWHSAFARQYVNVRACADAALYLSSLESRTAYDAIVLEPPVVGSDDIAELMQHVETRTDNPAIVVILSARQPGLLPAAVALGVDLPLLDSLSADEIAEATVRRFKRRPVKQRGSDRWALDSLRWLLEPPGATQPIQLSYKECQFLLRLAESPGQPVARAVFSDLFGATADTFDQRRLDIMVRRLREKVSDISAQGLPMNTAHGIGYALAAPLHVIGPRIGNASSQTGVGTVLVV